jgi:hypothetical protein
LQRALKRLKLSRKEAHATGTLHRSGDQLIAAPRAIEINAATHNDDLADRWRLFTRANRATEANYIECGLFISEREVLVTRRTSHGALHLTNHNAVGQRRVSADALLDTSGDL